MTDSKTLLNPGFLREIMFSNFFFSFKKCSKEADRARSISCHYLYHLGQISSTLWAMVSSSVGRGSSSICLTWVLWRFDERACLEQCLGISIITIITHLLWSSQLRKYSQVLKTELISTLPTRKWTHFLKIIWNTFLFFPFLSPLSLKPNLYVVLYFASHHLWEIGTMIVPFHTEETNAEIFSSMLNIYS